MLSTIADEIRRLAHFAPVESKDSLRSTVQMLSQWSSQFEQATGEDYGAQQGQIGRYKHSSMQLLTAIRFASEVGAVDCEKRFFTLLG